MVLCVFSGPFVFAEKHPVAPANAPAVVEWDAGERKLKLHYNGQVIFEAGVCAEDADGREIKDGVIKFDSSEMEGDKVQQSLTFSPLKAQKGVKLVLRGTVTGSEEAFSSETDSEAQKRFRYVRNSVGLSHNLRNNAVYDRRWDWVLIGPADGDTRITPKDKSDGTITFSWTSRADSLELLFRPRFYQKHKELTNFQPWTYTVWKGPVTGFCTWWAYKYDFTQKTVDELTKVFKEKHLPDFGYQYIQLDDTYQIGNGSCPQNWLTWNDKFPGGPEYTIDKIRSIGMKPGIWVHRVHRPSDPHVADIGKQHPDWFVQKADGSLYHNQGFYLLDTSNEEACEQMAGHLYRELHKQGWDYVKIDGAGDLLYAYKNKDCADHFSKVDKTPSQSLRDWDRIAREELGPDTYILTCWGVYPGLNSIGLVDGARLGSDGFGPAGLQQFNSWNGVVWRNDPDHCDVMAPWLKEKTTMKALEVEEAMTDTIVQPAVVSMAGAVLMVSDKVEDYTDDSNLEGMKRSGPVLFTVPGQLYDYEARASGHYGAKLRGGEAPWWMLEIDRPFENWSVLSRFNWRQQDLDWKRPGTPETQVKFGDLGLDPDDEYVIFEFWTQTYLGKFKDAFTAPAQDDSTGLSTFVIRQARPYPWLLSASRHLSQGGVSLLDITWNQERQALSGKSQVVIGDPYKLTIYVPQGYRFKTAKVDGEKTETTCQTETVTVRLVPTATKAVDWELIFETDSNAVSLTTLLEEMLDRSVVAEYPQPEFVCKQASSYNRRSKTPGTGQWFSGGDFDQFYGCDSVEGRKEWIMLDADGPGVITRWWQTQYRGAGTIRIYLDRSPEPIFKGTGDELVGGNAIVGPPLAASVGGGRNLYLPIPFSQHCKITFESTNPDADFTSEKPGFKDESLFYMINYLQYPKGTLVKSLTRSDLKTNGSLIAKVNDELQRPEKNQLPIHRTVKGGQALLKPDESMTREISGPGAICQLRIKIDARDIPQAMRSTVLSIDFDGKQRAWAPLGEFFGSGLGVNPYTTWWRKVDKDGWMTCWWPMPFKESATVKVTNFAADDSVEVYCDDIGITDWQWTDRSMYFHSAWRGENLKEIGCDLDTMEVWNYITINGKGVYVGDSLSLYNRPRMDWGDQGWIGPWWGEGDDQIWVDNESFPSHFGTGSEDYFGYAFNHTSPFSAPFHAQPMAQGNWGVGHTTNVRVRNHDRIPFMSKFKFDMELYHWQPNRKIDYATTTHWYAFDGAVSNGLTAAQNVRDKVAQPLIGDPPQINGPVVTGIWPGTPFLYAIPTTGTRPIHFTVDGLPKGLKVDPATGFISGYVDREGRYPVTLRAENEFGKTESQFQIVCGQTLALTPPMGWMTWNFYGCDIDEAKIMEMADAMVDSGMRDVGYQYINIDDCWAFERAEDGSIIVDKKRFPNGIKPVADYVHARGLKLGIYSDAAEHTCGGALGSYGFEEQDARSFAEWGVDYLKYDYCNAPEDQETAIKRYTTMAQALRNSGRSIVFSVCEWGPRKPWLWAGPAGGNLWRTTWDIRNIWETPDYNNGNAGIMNVLDQQVGLAQYASLGHWNDPDMLVVGLYDRPGPAKRNAHGCTDTEYRTNMSLWCLLAAPLFTSCDLRDMNDVTREILTNTEVLAVNQDPLGSQARRIIKDGDLEVWAKDMQDGSKVVGLLNRSMETKTMTLRWQDLQITGPHKIRDLWLHKDLGTAVNEYGAQVPGHGCLLLRVSK